MLPVYTADHVHHRYGASAAPGAAWRAAAAVLPLSRQKRPPFVRLLQIVILLCLLVPASWLLATSIPLPWREVNPARNKHGRIQSSEELLSEHDGNGGELQVTDDDADDVAPPPRSRQRDKQKAFAANRKMMGSNPLPLPGEHLEHLVLVAGHAVYVGRDYSEASKEASWFLEEYQKIPGEAASFVEHIRLGILEASKDPDAMLLFSGGQTRLAAGPRSEGLSYWLVAEAASWFNITGVRERTFTEEHARDSFENLLFSMCRFYELSGHYPDQVTVVSYTLKEQRFKQLHRAALRFPATRFKFVGSDLPAGAIGATEGEARTVAAFKEDPYGCAHEELLQKRLRRDPFAVGPPHPSRCPALKGLLQYCEPELYTGKLPWLP